jgi:hypothetical protein
MVEKTFTHVEKGVAGEIHVSALVVEEEVSRARPMRKVEGEGATQSHTEDRSKMHNGR